VKSTETLLHCEWKDDSQDNRTIIEPQFIWKAMSVPPVA